MALDAESCYADSHLCRIAFMLSVASKLYTLSVIMLSVVMLNVVASRTRDNELEIAKYFCYSRLNQCSLVVS